MQAASPGLIFALMQLMLSSVPYHAACGHAAGAANKDLVVIPPSPPTHSLQRTAPRPPTRNLLGALPEEVPPAQGELPEFKKKIPRKKKLFGFFVESDPQAMGCPKFSNIGGGRVRGNIISSNCCITVILHITFGLQYHVNRSTTIGSSQAEKIMGHVKPSMVAKDMAVALWGRIGLAQRTYGGKVAPKDYKNPDCVARKELSPAKVGLVLG